MRRQLLGWCIRAYPRARRERDGAMLHDLAIDLADDHGTAREALALLRGGMVERIRQSSVARRAAVATLLAAVAATAVAVPASGEVNVESEQIVTSDAH